MTIQVGQKARFDPMRELRGYGVQDLRQEVAGTVFCVNRAHGWFGVTYGPGLRTSYRSDDVGRAVKVAEYE